MKHLVVIGGMTGVTAAYALLTQGFQVTLVDKNRYVAMETSYANGGQWSASNAEVWNHPSTLIKGMKWMLTPDAPLLVNPTPSWHKISWMTEFVAAMGQYAHNTVTTTRLAIEAQQYPSQCAVGRPSPHDAQHDAARRPGQARQCVLQHSARSPGVDIGRRDRPPTRRPRATMGGSHHTHTPRDP